MEKGVLRNRCLGLGVALVSLAFVGSSYAAGRSASASLVFQTPVRIIDATRPLPVLYRGAWPDPPPPGTDESMNEVAKLVKEMVREEEARKRRGTTLPDLRGGLAEGVTMPFPGFF